jgi:flagellar motor switch protein FliN/FliY
MADESDPIGQAEIEQLVKRAGQSQPGAPLASTTEASPTATSGTFGQDEIEALLNSQEAAAGKRGQPAAASGRADAASTANRTESGSTPGGAAAGVAAADVEFLLSQAEQALASAQGTGGADALASAKPFRLTDFSAAPPSTDTATLELIRDVELDLKIELGRTHMYLEDVLKLSKGSVVPLDKLAGDPVDIYVNGRLIARGEVLILNDNFCVRVAELVAADSAAG